MQDTQVQSLGWGDPLQMGMATHSSIIAWRILCTEEPHRLQSMGLQRVRHDWAANTQTHTDTHNWRHRFDFWVGKIPWRRKWQPTPVFLPGKYHDREARRAIDHRVTGSWTWPRDWACTHNHLTTLWYNANQLYADTYSFPLQQASSSSHPSRSSQSTKLSSGRIF